MQKQSSYVSIHFLYFVGVNLLIMEREKTFNSSSKEKGRRGKGKGRG